MKLTTQGFYRVSVYMNDNKKEFKQYYVAADSIQEATVIVEDKLKEGNISDNLYINSILVHFNYICIIFYQFHLFRKCFTS